MLKKDLSILFLLVSCLTLGCSQADQQSQGQEKKSAISFETTEYDYGNIMQGSDGTCAFVFTNTGDAPLLLTNVRSSCGCTIPEWPKKPIRPGNKATIKVRYNTRVIGGFSKTISVYSNAGDTPVVLHIKGRVEEAETE